MPEGEAVTLDKSGVVTEDINEQFLTNENGNDGEREAKETPEKLAGRFSKLCIAGLDRLKAEFAKPISRKKLIQNMLKGGVMGLSLVALFQAEEHHRNFREDRVTETETEDGKRFEHEDKMTTHLINTVCGMEHFTDQEKLTIARSAIKRTCIKNHVSIPTDIKNWNLEQLLEFDDTLEKTGPHKDNNRAGMLWYALSGYLQADVPHKQGHLYDEVWREEKKAGCPKVRLCTEEEADTDLEERTHYQPSTNTISIMPEDLLDQQLYQLYAAEMSHAILFKEKPIESWTLSFRDAAATEIEALRTGETFRHTYDNTLYEKEGTHEFKAHKEVQPVIEGTFAKAKDRDTSELLAKARLNSEPYMGHLD